MGKKNKKSQRTPGAPARAKPVARCPKAPRASSHPARTAARKTHAAARRRGWKINMFNGNSVNLGWNDSKRGLGSATKPIRLQKDEYICDINGSTDFATTEFAANPGISGTFPWVATMAPMFEKYRVVSMAFYYKPQVSQYADSGRAGKVMLSFQYDASLPPPSSKQQVEDTSPVADGMAYDTIFLSLSPHDIRMGDSYYVRNGPVPMSSDIKTYDFGKFFISTSGMEAAELGNIGELRVRYTFDLIDPVLRQPTIAGVQASPCPPVYCCIFTQNVNKTLATCPYTLVGPATTDYNKLDVVLDAVPTTCKAIYTNGDTFIDLISPGCYLIDATFYNFADYGTGVPDTTLRVVSGQGNLLLEIPLQFDRLSVVQTAFCADKNDHGFKFEVKAYPASTWTGTGHLDCRSLRITMVS